jgi:hypothetical protein
MFAEVDYVVIHDEGAEAVDAVYDADGKLVSPAQPGRTAWPKNFIISARPYATSTAIRQISALTRRAIKEMDAVDDTDKQLIGGCASCAVLVEGVKGNPFSEFADRPYPDDPMERVEYWSDMPTSVTVHVAGRIVETGSDPFTRAATPKNTKTASARA